MNRKRISQPGAARVRNAPPYGGLADNLGGRGLRLSLVVLASLYLSLMVLDQFKRSWANALCHPVPVFFVQISGLFAGPAATVIDYRAEGWLCGGRRYLELDMDKLFPMLAGNKENRFYRTMHFYRRNRQVMQALDSFLVAKYPVADIQDSPTDSLGGVRLTMIRTPLPVSRSEVKRHHRLSLAEYPEDQRKAMYWTPRSKIRKERCVDAQ